MLLVVLIAVGVTAYFDQQGTTGVFYQFTAMSAQRDQTIVANLLTDAGEKGQINQVQIEKLGQNFGQPIFLVSQGGDVLVASDPAQVGVKITEPLPTIATKIIYDAKPTYLLMRSAVPMPGVRQDVMTWVSPGDPAPQFGAVSLGTFTVPVNGAAVNSFPVAGAAGNVTFEEPNTLQRFVQSINRSFLISVAAALALTTVLTFGLSRRILTPVQALTEAARKLEKGDLGQRVRVRSKDEIGELAHAFNSMADGLSRADQLRRNMVSDVAHELRTPLANVRGYLEAMRDGVVQASPATIDSLYEETLLLSRMVDDLQELALAEAGQLRLAKEALEPAELVAAAVTATQAQASQKGIELKAEISPNLPTLAGDGQRLGQAMRNLITNSIAHTPEGGTILVKADTTSEGVILSVRDTGEGIAAEHLPFIFERFYRADPARQRSKGGSGLGLAIVKQWVTAHGGTVRAESTGVAGEGSTVTMWLPTKAKAEGEI
jgi:signal transduction histidine kinase